MRITFAVWIAAVSLVAGSVNAQRIPGMAMASDPASTSASAAAGCSAAAWANVNPDLDLDFLLEPVETGNPGIVIAHYDLTRGLLAGYRSSSGKRLVFRAQWVGKAVLAEILHRDPATGRIEPLLRPVRRPDGAGRAGVLELAGADVLGYIKGKGKDAALHSRFMELVGSETGQALYEAVPALYAALEPLEDDAALAKLQTPYGVVVSALQAITKVFGGFEHAARVVGQQSAARMRAACGEECRYRGAHFTVQASGHFDVLSKAKSRVSRRNGACSVGPLGASPSPGPFSAGTARALGPLPKNGDGFCTEPGGCFGYCGYDCVTPGNIQTPECWGHDMCVCRWGHLACLGPELPVDNCWDCYDLISAIGSWISALLDELLEALGW